MKIKMKVKRVGAYQSYRVGQEYEVDDGTALAWIEQGKAVAVEESAPKPVLKKAKKKERASVVAEKETTTKDEE